MDALWSVFALVTTVLAPHRATSALLMTGLNHAICATIMARTSNIGFKEMLGLEGEAVVKENNQ